MLYSLYNGIALFDIDGTLTSGTDNYGVVKDFLDKGYAVGINTAGMIYSMYNIQKFPWMPSNLFTFMKNTNFITFNNIASGIVAGKPNSYPKTLIETYKEKGMEYEECIGIAKGYAIIETSLNIGIYDMNKVVMFDDRINVLNGIKKYNNKINLYCAGENCSLKKKCNLNRKDTIRWN